MTSKGKSVSTDQEMNQGTEHDLKSFVEQKEGSAGPAQDAPKIRLQDQQNKMTDTRNLRK